MEYPEELRFLSYLSPGIPRAFFEAIVEHVRRALGQRASLSVESRVSGPMRGAEDPFSRGDADVGFTGARRTASRKQQVRRLYSRHGRKNAHKADEILPESRLSLQVRSGGPGAST